MVVEEHVPLAPFTTFYIGGPARFFARISDVGELRDALAFAKEKNLNTLVLGGGSNVLVPDAGFDGLVIKIEIGGVEKNNTTLIVGAGESWDALAARAVSDGLWGIENLSGIPGTVGAAPVQNIGAYGAELKDTLAWLEAFDTETGEVVRFTNNECGFGYRTSVFKKTPGRYVVLRVAFALQRGGVPNITYKDLSIAFANKAPVLKDIRNTVLAIRAQKFPNLQEEGTAGSFFLNPVVSAETAARLGAQYPLLPQFAAQGGVKLSLAWLLDNVLNLKGAHVGGARLFEKQPLVIAATRDAQASDVRALAQKIKTEAREQLGLEIEEEVRIL
jgi:UDP-N-acetylmuramate dehydrogenase